MTEKETKLQEKLIKLHIKRVKTLKVFNSYKTKLLLLQLDFDKKLYSPLISFLTDSLKNNNYSITYNGNHQKIDIFKIEPDETPQLISNVFFTNIPSLHSPLVNPINLKITYFTSNNDLNWELDKLIYLGKLSQSLKKNQTKFITKAENLFKKHHSLFQKTQNKTNKYTKPLQDIDTKIINLYYPHMLQSLKEGIKFNEKITFPFSLDFGSFMFNNITRLKLLKNNMFLIHEKSIFSPETDPEHEYKIPKENLKDFILNSLISVELLNRIETPLFYPQSLEKIKSLY